MLRPLHDGTPDEKFDIDVEIMELPHIFRTTLDTIPDSIPYIHVQPKSLPQDSNVNIGLVWSAGDWDHGRSVPFDFLAPVLETPRIRWYVLQQGPALREVPHGLGVVVEPDNIIEAAAIIASLHLLISVDTMAAHLAGAMGVPVWTLLQHKADWCWMETRENSPWYPTMRLFRQTLNKEWRPVVANVANLLKRFIDREL